MRILGGMKKTLVLIACLTLAACGKAGNFSPYDSSYHDEVADNGLRFRLEPKAIPILNYSVDQYAYWYDVIQSCTGLTATPPLLIIEHGLVGPERSYAGYYWWGTDHVVVSDAIHDPDRVTKHEYVHYLLDRNGIAQDHNNKAYDCV